MWDRQTREILTNIIRENESNINENVGHVARHTSIDDVQSRSTAGDGNGTSVNDEDDPVRGTNTDPGRRRMEPPNSLVTGLTSPSICPTLLFSVRNHPASTRLDSDSGYHPGRGLPDSFAGEVR